MGIISDGKFCSNHILKSEIHLLTRFIYPCIPNIIVPTCRSSEASARYITAQRLPLPGSASFLSLLLVPIPKTRPKSLLGVNLLLRICFPETEPLRCCLSSLKSPFIVACCIPTASLWLPPSPQTLSSSSHSFRAT